MPEPRFPSSFYGAAVLLVSLYLGMSSSAFAESATDYVKKSEEQTMGDSLKASVSMVITRPQSERSLKFKLSQWHREKSLLKILEPVKDRDTGSLRIGMGLWQFLPNVNRIVRIPPSMMLQSWMGSDFTNDDLVKTSSLSRDYTHAIDGEETMNGDATVRIVCMPKPEAPVVWGKIRIWLRKKDSVPLKQEYYSEHGELIKVMEGRDIKTFGKHTLTTTLVMSVPKKPGEMTTMKFANMVFDQPIDDAVFSQENLRKAVSTEE